ncbi:MAG: 16S rRNA (cytosine(1402)-N(4))-methyltransferase [Candidatus Colwellbacteria bacterium CG10_big_fil_rev_8_21_14_0_10_42_22]|uniref:Ribosomal RNA small subunit methyltransferase H n=1 Tax=Candidatus Colwellbacteria bacterium CG10_big_fil_rev_8_21_14_0_10_42_22 TaxID=1974540 RepID=A0A2H0VF49_9BACT|nr:MAG: 16S rRNA (cytosine(1402)-N(4))-methyltransferase [Candidatus Colwellbacteria bacterium CG10_big_fil_rev_8_21_14_0_10_42_22]
MAHVPVLLNEVLETLAPREGQIMIDATVGGGGHGIPIARRLSPGGTFIGIDWDEKRLKELREAIGQEVLDLEKLILVCSNYADLVDVLEREGIGKVNGLLIDLGFSSDQLGEGKGFAFKGKEEPLAMTYSDYDTPLYQILGTLGERQIAEIIKDLSDERYAGRIAKAIVLERKKSPIVTNHDLAKVVRGAVPKNYEGGRIDPATRTFMAFRIYANRELENLGRILGGLTEIVRSGGRAVIISYHSKEDAMVKHFFKDLAEKGEAILISKKAIKPTDLEVKQNPRSRSAKLRAIEIK